MINDWSFFIKEMHYFKYTGERLNPDALGDEEVTSRSAVARKRSTSINE